MGTTVTLFEKREIGTDDFGAKIFEDVPISVENVLIAPVSSDDVLSKTDLEGKKGVYVLAIPKGDAHDWEDVEVEFFGQRWKSFGIPLEGMEEHIPLQWNKKVTVERYG